MDDGFKTPGPDYFAALAERVTRQRAPVRRNYRSRIAVAATALLVIFATLLLVKGPAPASAPTSEELMSRLNEEEIEAYLLQYADDFDEEVLFEETDLTSYE